jgi:Na+/glutamate symporter
MRKAIFIGFIVLGAALGLFSAMTESVGVQVVMAAVGAVAGVAIGGALSRVGRRRRAIYVSPMADSPETTEDRVSNYWLDHGRLTAAPGVPDPDETDQISLKP